MLLFWLTLVADAYPLICWLVSSASFVHHQAPVPGCWFSMTLGLLWATAVAGDIAISTPTTRQIPCKNEPMWLRCRTVLSPEQPLPPEALPSFRVMSFEA